MSSTCTIGRHGEPSLVILIAPDVQAWPARLFSTRAKRLCGGGPYAVALRRMVGENSSSASVARSASTSTLQRAYAVCGFVSDVSVRKSAPPAPYTLQEDV